MAPVTSLAGKRVLLIITGGIAAYKALELIRLLRKSDCAVTSVITAAGMKFVTPLSVQALCEDRVYTDMFSLTDESEMGHIQLSRSADLIVVAPASGDIIAKMAAGIANDLATTLLLATDKPVLVAPAMNVRMWQHPATVSNMDTITRRGVISVPPDEGPMACGEFGPGRLAAPERILGAINRLLKPGQDLVGRRAIVTSGPTHEAIDPVRYLANRSSGRQGHAIAAALAAHGATVTLISGPVSLADPQGVTTTHVESAAEMRAAVQAALPADVAIFCAAVADWRVKPSKVKIKKSGVSPTLTFIENPDILSEVAHAEKNRPNLVIGFAAETELLGEHAAAKRVRKGCDWLLANDVGPGSDTMGGLENEILLLTEEGSEVWHRTTKEAIAERLAERIVRFFIQRAGS